MRTLLLAALALLAYLPIHAVDGFNMPGNDYGNFNADSWFVCRNTCGGDGRCQGWSWAKPGVQGTTGHCWLKHTVSALVRDKCCIAGYRKDISAGDLKAEDNTNRPGRDIKQFDSRAWEDCQAACGSEEGCAAWSYVRAGVQGATGRCWLKAQVPNPVYDPVAISGVKYRHALVH